MPGKRYSQIKICVMSVNRYTQICGMSAKRYILRFVPCRLTLHSQICAMSAKRYILRKCGTSPTSVESALQDQLLPTLKFQAPLEAFVNIVSENRSDFGPFERISSLRTESIF